jgi:lipoprotein NlpD
VAEGTYVVKKGDTLYSIALEHGVDYREVAAWNRLDDPTKIGVGQVLRVTPPEASRVQVGRAKLPDRGEARPLDVPPPASTKTPPPQPSKPEPAAADFIWPARGKVIAGFAEPRRKGIDIDGKLGDPVIAAAAGRVTYTGTGIPGLGKLVVIKHDNGFITVYAHNKDILVKEQQAVKRGQKIAEVGNTDADRPKLHFQIRKGSAAVDPLRYLPSL